MPRGQDEKVEVRLGVVVAPTGQHQPVRDFRVTTQALSDGGKEVSVGAQFCAPPSATAGAGVFQAQVAFKKASAKHMVAAVVSCAVGGATVDGAQCAICGDLQ